MLSVHTFTISSTLGLDRYWTDSGSLGIEWGLGVDDVDVEPGGEWCALAKVVGSG